MVLAFAALVVPRCIRPHPYELPFFDTALERSEHRRGSLRHGVSRTLRFTPFSRPDPLASYRDPPCLSSARIDLLPTLRPSSSSCQRRSRSRSRYRYVGRIYRATRCDMRRRHAFQDSTAHDAKLVIASRQVRCASMPLRVTRVPLQRAPTGVCCTISEAHRVAWTRWA
jgi:hypothetical protein